MYIQTRCFISLVNNNHVNNRLKETLVYVHYGSIVNNRPKKCFINCFKPVVNGEISVNGDPNIEP